MIRSLTHSHTKSAVGRIAANFPGNGRERELREDFALQEVERNVPERRRRRKKLQYIQ